MSTKIRIKRSLRMALTVPFASQKCQRQFDIWMPVRYVKPSSILSASLVGKPVAQLVPYAAVHTKVLFPFDTIIFNLTFPHIPTNQ
jgi:hypothetical protein